MEPTVSVNDLQQQLTHEHVVIFDCRYDLSDKSMGSALYKKSHIPGAHFADLETHLSAPATILAGRHPLPEAEAFSHFMRQCGVDQTSLVVAYDDHKMAYASRLWWLCRYFGHSNVAVLNGGAAAWEREGGELDTERRGTFSRGDFMAVPNISMVADFEEVLSRRESGQALIIDSREPHRFDGFDEPIDAVAGHIPGAADFDWRELTNEDGYWRLRDFHHRRWQNLSSSCAPIVYCGSGVTACVNLMSIYATGRTDARLYAGSWSQWSQQGLQRHLPEAQWLERG